MSKTYLGNYVEAGMTKGEYIKFGNDHGYSTHFVYTDEYEMVQRKGSNSIAITKSGDCYNDSDI